MRWEGMGSPVPGESTTNGIDSSVGGLVWVQRRNGSWWPGRIMGLHELSQSCLVSPKSGTPVQLLGRQDAIVDWYNLERSKRVKAFRCGEYDQCIEKARVSAASSNKKPVRYARREDAIIHALQLENTRLGKELLSLSSGLDKFGSENGGLARESPVVSHSGYDNEDVTNDLSCSKDNSNSAPELSQSGTSFEVLNQNGSSKMHSMKHMRRRTPNDSEDDGTEGLKRMRGLEDLGVSVMSKSKVRVAPEILEQDSASQFNSNTGNCVANGTSVNGGKGHSLTLKQKRSQVANAHEFSKRKNRRRQLTKVLESTAMLSVPVVCDQLPTSIISPVCRVTDTKTSRLDSNGSKKSYPHAIHNSDSTEAACENGASINIHDRCREASQISHAVEENEASGTSGLVGNEFADKLFDVPFACVIGNEKHAAGPSPFSCSSGTSQNGALGQQSFHVSQSEAPSLKNEGQNSDLNVVGHRTEKRSSKWQSKGKRNSRHKILRKHVDDESHAYLAGTENYDGLSQGACQRVDGNAIGTSQGRCKPVAEGQLDGFRDLSKHIKGKTEVKLLPEGSPRSLPCRQSRFMVNSKYQAADFPGRNSCSNDLLFDVKIEVKPSYRPQHVPLVSLVSKLNGKAFIGHHLTVEVLDNGHCDRVLRGVGCNLEGGNDTYCVFKPNSVTRQKPSKNLTRFSPIKSSKMKKSGLLNKKIRRLSSLTRHSLSEDQKRPMADKVKGPVISCIPLKVVFSRINEAVSACQIRPTH